MNLRLLSWGEWLAGVCGVLLVVALFLPWYSVGGEELTAWEAMAVNDVILMVAGVLALAAPIMVGLRRFSSISVATTSMAILPAVVGLIVTIWRVLSPAPSGDASLEIGAWLGLAATLGIAVGAWQGAKDEGPARRNAAAERRGAEEGLAAAELLSLTAPGPK